MQAKTTRTDKKYIFSEKIANNTLYLEFSGEKKRQLNLSIIKKLEDLLQPQYILKPITKIDSRNNLKLKVNWKDSHLWTVVAHAFNLTTQEAEVDGSLLSLRPELDPG